MKMASILVFMLLLLYLFMWLVTFVLGHLLISSFYHLVNKVHHGYVTLVWCHMHWSSQKFLEVMIITTAILTLRWAKKSKISMGPALRKFPGSKLWIEDHLNWLWFLFGGQWMGSTGCLYELAIFFPYPIDIESEK